MLATQYAKSPRKANSFERPNSPSSGHSPNLRREITAAARNRIAGPATATSYHPGPTRQRNTRPTNSRTPAEPPTRVVTTKAETMGPRLPARWKTADVCGSEEPREKSTAGAPTRPRRKRRPGQRRASQGVFAPPSSRWLEFADSDQGVVSCHPPQGVGFLRTVVLAQLDLPVPAVGRHRPKHREQSLLGRLPLERFGFAPHFQSAHPYAHHGVAAEVLPPG